MKDIDADPTVTGIPFSTDRGHGRYAADRTPPRGSFTGIGRDGEKVLSRPDDPGYEALPETPPEPVTRDQPDLPSPGKDPPRQPTPMIVPEGKRG